MINILFRVLTIYSLNTLVYSGQQPFPSESNGNRFCFNLHEVKVCFQRKDSNSICKKGSALTEEQYLRCILPSAICDAPGRFPIPMAPNAYYTCKLNQYSGTFEKHVNICESDKFFDTLTLTCLRAEELSISRSISDESSLRPPPCTEVGVIPDDLYCKAFYFCPMLRSPPLKLFCGPNMYYDENLKKCTSQMTESCKSKFLKWEDFIENRAKKYLAAVEATLKLGFSVSERTLRVNDITKPENNQKTGNGILGRLKGKIPKRRVYFEKPRRILRNQISRIKRLLTLPWRLRKLRQQRRSKKSNINPENLEKERVLKDCTNDNAGIKRSHRTLPFIGALLNRFPHHHRKISKPCQVHIDPTEEQEKHEETEFGKNEHSKGHKSPIKILFTCFPDKERKSEHRPKFYIPMEDQEKHQQKFGVPMEDQEKHQQKFDVPMEDQEKDHQKYDVPMEGQEKDHQKYDVPMEDQEKLEESELEQYSKGRGLGKQSDNLFNQIQDEQRQIDYFPWPGAPMEDQEKHEEPELKQYSKRKRRRKPIDNLFNSSPDEERNTQQHSLFDDMMEDLKTLEQTKFGINSKGKGLRNPLISLFSRIRDEESTEHQALPDDMAEAQEKPEKTKFGIHFKEKRHRLSSNPVLNRLREERRRRKHHALLEDKTEEQESPEETKFGGHFKGKRRRKPLKNVLSRFPRKGRKKKHRPLLEDKTEEQESPEETKFGVHIKGKRHRNPLHTLLNLLPLKGKKSENQQQADVLNEGEENPDELEKIGVGKPSKGSDRFPNEPTQTPQSYPGQDELTEDEENAEEPELEKHSKGKGNEKPDNSLLDDISDEEETDEAFSEQDELTEEEEEENSEEPEETELNNPPNTLPDRFSDEQRPGHDDETEEQENPEESELETHSKGNEYEKPNSDLLNHIPDEEETFEDSPEQDELTEEEEENAEDSELGKENEKPDSDLLNHIPDEEETSEASPEQDELTEEEEDLEEHGFDTFPDRFPDDETQTSDSSPEQDDLTEEQENTEENEFENPLKGIGLDRQLNTFPDHLPDDETQSESYSGDLTEEQENPEEAELGKNFQDFGLAKSNFLKHLPDEEEEYFPDQDELTEEEEHSEESELEHFNGNEHEQSNDLSAHFHDDEEPSEVFSEEDSIPEENDFRDYSEFDY